MADCKIVDAAAKSAVQSIEGISKSYKSSGQEFVDAITNAISTMEGEAKDALEKFFTTTVREFTTEQLPDAIEGMSKLLEGNRENFENVDRQLAESINGG